MFIITIESILEVYDIFNKNDASNNVHNLS